ncbi:MAG: N-acetylmuramoyl-L-alanine amidase [Bacteroidales bacterium]|nr:N-acetylmuramoyl-L-alanine amidase [Bacteroidales bacterium]
MKTYILVFGLYFLFYPYTKGLSNPPVSDKVSIVVIDPGHGGKDPGALGTKIKEKDVVLAIALKVGELIKSNFEDVKVIYTRDTDEFIPLNERANIANKNKADLFISIHANSLPKSKAYGTETFVMGISKDAGNFEVAKKENSVINLEEDYETKYEGFDPNSIDSYIIFSVMQKTYQGHSIAFAQMIENEFSARAKRFSRGVKQDGFWVLWSTTMPSVLIETGFLTDGNEEKFLGSENGQDILASAIYRAFRQYKESIESKSNFSNLHKEIEQNKEISVQIGKDLADDQASPELYFKVQILVSKNSVDKDNPYFKDFKYPEEFKSGSWYKYAVGKTTSYSEIIKYCSLVKETYPDAFVIAVKNNEIIKLKDALEEINP